MIDQKEEVINEFVSNVEGIASDLVACFELKHKKEIRFLSRICGSLLVQGVCQVYGIAPL